jgi:hypothetical protein
MEAILLQRLLNLTDLVAGQILRRDWLVIFGRLLIALLALLILSTLLILILALAVVGTLIFRILVLGNLPVLIHARLLVIVLLGLLPLRLLALWLLLIIVGGRECDWGTHHRRRKESNCEFLHVDDPIRSFLRVGPTHPRQCCCRNTNVPDVKMP